MHPDSIQLFAFNSKRYMAGASRSYDGDEDPCMLKRRRDADKGSEGEEHFKDDGTVTTTSTTKTVVAPAVTPTPSRRLSLKLNRTEVPKKSNIPR